MRRSSRPVRDDGGMVEHSDEGGDPACWAHLFDEDEAHTSAGEASDGGRDAMGRLRDHMPVNQPYAGIVADGYHAFVSIDDVFPDDAVYEALLAETDGPALELGCGTGRPMLRWVADGHDVEGIDSSADMLSILQRNAAARGLEPVVHHGDIAPLQLDRTYEAIVCPAGTFTLIDDEDRIRRAIASYFEHLRPGGALALSLSTLEPTGDSSLRWRIRRTGTLADGTHVVVHEALLMEPDDRCCLGYNRIETFDVQGHLTDTLLRRFRLRSWDPTEAAELLEAAGFAHVDTRGGDDEHWVTVARRPG